MFLCKLNKYSETRKPNGFFALDKGIYHGVIGKSFSSTLAIEFHSLPQSELQSASIKCDKWFIEKNSNLMEQSKQSGCHSSFRSSGNPCELINLGLVSFERSNHKKLRTLFN